MSHGPNLAASQQRIAALVDAILEGTRPVDLPVEQPTKLETLGLTIPPSVLLRADQVIE